MAKKSSGKKKSWWRRLLALAGWAGVAFLASTVLAAVVFRFAPIPFSALMAQRRVQSWCSEKPYISGYEWVSLDDIAPCMGVAVIAGEDQNFPEHFGFDWKAIEKAVEHNEKSRRKRGASTVSMQTAKNLFLWETRSWVRKGFEVYFTLLIETTWSKKRILEVYLNIVEFGDGIFGVEAASRAFFGKPAKRLSASEAALLAAVLPNPHKFRANAPSEYVRGRQEWILGQMRQLGGDQVVKTL